MEKVQETHNTTKAAAALRWELYKTFICKANFKMYYVESHLENTVGYYAPMSPI